MAATARSTSTQSDDLGCVGCALAIVIVIFGWLAVVSFYKGLVAPGIVVVVIGLALLLTIGLVHANYSAKRHQLRVIKSTEIARYHAMKPREFEEAIAFLCSRDGCTQVSVVGGAGDLGADVLATAPDGRRIVIQCKRYAPTTKVGSPDLQRFGGTCYSIHGAQVAVVVTTSVFTKPAAEYGSRHGIRLFDQAALAAWATRTGPTPWTP